ncbi:DUF362 domain-containing protein [Microbacter margulisiae]|uniref:Uncharacterized protein (DUF362 family) n=1 Tax=Microbacter margulisiae TaxID=1350067 RepID=A0A7W5GZZ6_9PORP|nr:DUF362 domain-containing protein [Microbacter margulisiae]MBB3185988.1 uncharacterized protein (DUF362 family) [Microbacter margulisiae]
MNQEKFLHIIRCFQDINDRNIDSLGKIYDDRAKLTAMITELLGHDFLESVTGKKILLKPNWVKHSSKETDELCLRTNDQWVIAALEVILPQKPISVTIGDAPIQGCLWEKAISPSFIAQIEQLSEKAGIPVGIKDFRRRTFNPASNIPVSERNPISEYVILDIGSNSFLEPISNSGGNFRVNDYDYQQLAKNQRKGVHKYCITRALFDADIVISMPKIKTHQKTGMTGALKNIVGLNGDKDYLPHHRVGGTKQGGDCYPGSNILRRISEIFIDLANKKQGTTYYLLLHRLSYLLWKMSFPKNTHNLGAAWYGNDTTWRMVMDLNKIAIYGKADGSLSNKPQRQLYSLCDGIIGGQGNGPLHPDPFPFGFVSFTNDSALNDLCMTTLMGFHPDKIPLIHTALKLTDIHNVLITLDHKKINTLQDLEPYSIHTTAAPGWDDYLNAN